MGTTLDHFTPVCIAKLWGWNTEQIIAPENIQYLSKPCHLDKDRTTEARLTLARKQLQGAYISLAYYLSIEDPGFHLEKDKPKHPEKRKLTRDKKCVRERAGRSQRFWWG